MGVSGESALQQGNLASDGCKQERSSWGSTEQVAQRESKLGLGQIEEAKKEMPVLIGSVIGEDLGRICSVQQCGHSQPLFARHWWTKWDKL